MRVGQVRDVGDLTGDVAEARGGLRLARHERGACRRPRPVAVRAGGQGVDDVVRDNAALPGPVATACSIAAPAV
ncbi:hypothetical protein J2Z21_008848 [Streptomyces griseochromogenes]|uniref:Uncharacterized protein n=1 Tax=Streptomyces griseochromogenes TaxID=68214 RepID=A0A1B1AZ11_9ACTN|nr:hypothetical protein [Streptomyces griseochromogenes]ANP51787.1 hypothetical protein AVL59_21305 [Streptomyces griseochromogenes]MBP2055832.1 hypothetical protein [Streptomyces griseochromogenes]